jgi:hypothetical protein
MNEMSSSGHAGEALARPTRRRILRLLGGGALLTGTVGLGYEPMDAKRKKKCKRPCNSEEKCVRGKCVPLPRP